MKADWELKWAGWRKRCTTSWHQQVGGKCFELSEYEADWTCKTSLFHHQNIVKKKSVVFNVPPQTRLSSCSPGLVLVLAPFLWVSHIPVYVRCDDSVRESEGSWFWGEAAVQTSCRLIAAAGRPQIHFTEETRDLSRDFGQNALSQHLRRTVS